MDKQTIFTNNIIRYFINTIYVIFVFCVLLWLIVESIYDSVKNNDGRYFSSNIFAVMYLAQYISGILLYKKKFYKKTVNYNNNFRLFILTFILSIIISASAVVFLVNGINISVYSDLYNNTGIIGKVFLCIILVIEKLYSYNIYFVNVITFTTILLNLSSKISVYKDKLKGFISDSNTNITISDMLKEYSELQDDHRKVIDALNYVFTTVTIFGVVGAYFTLLNSDTEFSGIFTYIDVSFYLLLQGIYILAINKIQNTASDIKIVIGSPLFVNKFLSKSEMVDINGDIYDDYLESNNSDNLEKSKNIIRELNKKIDIMKNILFRNTIIATENSNDLYWIMFFNKLSEPWECFQIFGFDINNDQLIQKFVGVVVGMIGILRLNSRF